MKKRRPREDEWIPKITCKEVTQLGLESHLFASKTHILFPGHYLLPRCCQMTDHKGQRSSDEDEVMKTWVQYTLTKDLSLEVGPGGGVNMRASLEWGGTARYKNLVVDREWEATVAPVDMWWGQEWGMGSALEREAVPGLRPGQDW